MSDTTISEFEKWFNDFRGEPVTLYEMNERAFTAGFEANQRLNDAKVAGYQSAIAAALEEKAQAKSDEATANEYYQASKVKIAELTDQRDRLLEIIRSDAHAASFQSMAGYRTALIAKAKGVVL